MSHLTMERKMKTNIYDVNFKNEIKGYTISGLNEQISECTDMISEMKDINNEMLVDDYKLEIKLLKNELKKRNKVAQSWAI